MHCAIGVQERLSGWADMRCENLLVLSGLGRQRCKGAFLFWCRVSMGRARDGIRAVFRVHCELNIFFFKSNNFIFF